MLGQPITDLVSVNLVLGQPITDLASAYLMLGQPITDLASGHLMLGQPITNLASAYLMLGQPITDRTSAYLMLGQPITDLASAHLTFCIYVLHSTHKQEKYSSCFICLNGDVIAVKLRLCSEHTVFVALEGSLSCHSRCDTKPRCLRSHPKDRPDLLPFYD